MIPEVAAEVVGYARSPHRNPGLHVLVDVGASTLDICGFILWESGGDDQYTLLTADVPRLGAFELHRRRIEALHSELPETDYQRLLPDDPIAPIPEDAAAEYAPSGDEATIQKLRSVDHEYERLCANAEMRTIMALRKCRDPHSSRWDQGLPVFLCGGGAGMRQLRRSVEEESNERLTSADDYCWPAPNVVTCTTGACQ